MNNDTDIYSSFIQELNHLKVDGAYRKLKDIENKDGKFIFFKDKKYLNLASNDYLGLATDRKLQNEFFEHLSGKNQLSHFALSSSSSRLLTGNSILYSKLEKEISDLYNREDALIFNSGYHANIGILLAILKKGDAVFSDKLNHASIIDGMKLCNADFYRYKHLDYDHLEELLKKKRSDYDKIVIISEAIFSMDGDIANLERLVELKNKYKALLYIDEAHSVGVLGKNGGGLCEKTGFTKDIDIIVGTFGKALASLGAYAVIPKILKDYLINKMRPFIFTTALPPIILNWNSFIIKKLPDLEEKRKILSTLWEKLRYEIYKTTYKTLGDSQIVPIIIGKNNDTLKLSEKLQDRSFFALPIRPPTVPKGSSRIRISLTSNINWDDIKEIMKILKDF